MKYAPTFYRGTNKYASRIQRGYLRYRKNKFSKKLKNWFLDDLASVKGFYAYRKLNGYQRWKVYKHHSVTAQFPRWFFSWMQMQDRMYKKEQARLKARVSYLTAKLRYNK